MPDAGAPESAQEPAEQCARATLSRSQRLTQSRSFDDTFADPSKQVGRYMVMWRKRRRGGKARVGVIASKRTFRRAVDRNRAKRLLREAFRLSRHVIRDGYDVVLVARRPLMDSRRQEVEKELLKLFRRAGMSGDKSPQNRQANRRRRGDST